MESLLNLVGYVLIHPVYDPSMHTNHFHLEGLIKETLLRFSQLQRKCFLFPDLPYPCQGKVRPKKAVCKAAFTLCTGS